MLCGENEVKNDLISYCQLPGGRKNRSAEQLRAKCIFISPKNSATPQQLNEILWLIYLIRLCCGGNSLRDMIENSIPQFPAYQTAGGMFYYAVPVAYAAEIFNLKFSYY